MASLAFVAPALPGGTENLRRLAQELRGGKKSEVEDFYRRMKITREQWFIQPTPQGEMVIVYLEGEDLARTFQTLAASEEPLDVWLKEQAKSVHGIDFNKPRSAPLPELVYDSRPA
ncbi:MAG: hypothetical protein IH861_03625 [Chloroflexi bacterium]|nr:hypothetical protein [Chloroflexota bacterium]